MVVRLNVVNQVLNQVGGQCYSPTNAATTVGGLCANASQTLGNMQTILDVTKALGAQSANAPAGNMAGGGASPMMNFVAGAVITAAIGAFSPAAGALLGVAGSFAGLQTSKPSNQYYGLAKSLQNESSDIGKASSSYTDISGDSYTGAGQPITRASPAMNPVFSGKSMALDAAAANVSSVNSIEDIRDDIMIKFRQQIDDLGATQTALRNRGIGLGMANPDSGNDVAELSKLSPKGNLSKIGIPSYG